MRVYHRTSADDAERIMRDGFNDHADIFGVGVWVSDPPCDEASLPASKREALVAVDLSEEAITEYEVLWDRPGDAPSWARYREWIVPAAVLNRVGTVALGAGGGGTR